MHVFTLAIAPFLASQQCWSVPAYNYVLLVIILLILDIWPAFLTFFPNLMRTIGHFNFYLVILGLSVTPRIIVEIMKQYLLMRCN